MEKSITSANPFQILEEEGEGGTKGEKERQNETQEAETKEDGDENKEVGMPDIMEDDEAEDMELGDLDLDALEK